MKKLYAAIGIVFAPFMVSVTAGADLKPQSIDFNRGLEESRVYLQTICDTVKERSFNPPQLPGTRQSHIQLDCQGMEFEGKDRLVEFVYRDGELVIVWVLTTADEEDMLEDKLKSLYGTPTHQGKDFTAFTRDHVALRKDVKEVLFYSPSIEQMFESWFANSAKAAN